MRRARSQASPPSDFPLAKLVWAFRLAVWTAGTLVLWLSNNLTTNTSFVGKWFLQKDTCPRKTPAWIATQKVWAANRDEGSGYISYHVGADRDQLLHFAELCTTTLHTWATTADALDYADTLILDPFNA